VFWLDCQKKWDFRPLNRQKTVDLGVHFPQVGCSAVRFEPMICTMGTFLSGMHVLFIHLATRIKSTTTKRKDLLHAIKPGVEPMTLQHRRVRSHPKPKGTLREGFLQLCYKEHERLGDVECGYYNYFHTKKKHTKLPTKINII
jgi:hypothetical protein